MPIVRTLAPATPASFALTGRSEGDFAVTGPARQAKVAPTYRGVDGGTVVAWGGGTAYGLSIGAAEIRPVIKDGIVTVPVTTVALGDGTARLGGAVDLSPPDPLLTIPGSVQVLEKVPITAELAKELLSRVNPIFADLAKIEGTVSVSTRDLHLPLGEAIKTSGRGSGRLDLSGLKVEPQGLLGVILKLLGQAQGAQAIRVTGVDFAIRDGRVYYDDFTMIFADQLDLKFSGSVGFDETVDMAVSVPVRAALLERFGVKGVATEYARLLEGARVSIPIRGTRAAPALELDKLDIKPLLEKAAKGLLLRRVLEPISLPAETPATGPAEKPVERPVRDLLDLLRENWRLPDRQEK